MSSDATRSLATILDWALRSGGPAARSGPPIAEHRFHPDRRWRFDLAWPDLMLAIEVEGGSYVAGRHTRPAGFEGDCEKYNEAQLLGWTVLRVTPHMIDDGRALSFIERGLRAAIEREVTP